MSKKSLQQLPTHSRHISKDLPYLGYNKLPQIRKFVSFNNFLFDINTYIMTN